MKKILLFIAGFILCSQGALAYIDPGTGGVIVGSIWPLIIAAISAAGIFCLKIFFHPIKRLFKGKSKEK